MRVPFSYLPEQFADPEPIFARLREVIATGDFTLGKAVGEFEARFAHAVGVQFAFGVGSGTEALRLALRIVGAGPGDEVITTPMTFIATATAVLETGATPVFVDVEPDSGLLDATKIEKALTSKTKAILPVHLCGQMCDMKTIRQVADRHSVQSAEKAFGVVADLSSAIEIAKFEQQRFLERQQPIHPEFLTA